jgi:hypothetical protein
LVRHGNKTCIKNSGYGSTHLPPRRPGVETPRLLTPTATRLPGGAQDDQDDDDSGGDDDDEEDAATADDDGIRVFPNLCGGGSVQSLRGEGQLKLPVTQGLLLLGHQMMMMMMMMMMMVMMIMMMMMAFESFTTCVAPGAGLAAVAAFNVCVARAN